MNALAFFLYFLILLAIGVFSHKKLKNSDDFIVGSRSVNYWLTALSAHASDMSAWLFMGLPAAVYLYGLPMIWIPFGLCLGMFLNWQFVATKLRKKTEELDAVTLSSYFEKCFKDKAHIVRPLTAIMMLIYLSVYLTAGLIAMGLLLETVFGVNYYLGLSVATLVVMIYTFAGGFVTIAWTDLFQALFLIVVILIVPIVALFAIPGHIEGVVDAIHANKLPLTLFPENSITTIITLVLSWGLGYFGQPHIVTKFMGIKDANRLNRSKWLGMSWQVLSLGAATVLGLVGVGFYPQGLANPELVAVSLVKDLFPPFIAGFVLCAIIAANMSTMDSQILVAASVISEDIYVPFFNRTASKKKLLIVSRIGVIIIALIALSIAFLKSAKIMNTVLFAWSGLGASFGPLLLMSLYSNKITANGAIAGIVTGGLIAGLWPLTESSIPAMIPGFFLSGFMIYLVSCKKKECALL